MLILILITIIVAIIADNLLRSLIRLPKNFENRKSKTYAAVVQKTITFIIYAIALYYIFSELGIDMAPLLASASIIAIVAGIGARTLVQDLISGFFLLTQDTLTIGDYVKIGDTEGKIKQLGFRSLTIKGGGGELHTIPNGQVKKVTNYSRNKSFVYVEFLVKADQKIDIINKCLNEALIEIKKDKNFEMIDFEGSKVLGIDDFKEDKILMKSKIVALPRNRSELAKQYRYLVKKNFEKNKVELC